MKNKKIKKIIMTFAVLIVIILSTGILLFYNIPFDYKDETLMIWFISMPIFGNILAFIALKLNYNKKVIEFKKDYNYFRDLIKKYNPSLLCLLYSKNTYPKIMIVGLLELEKKNKIEIKEDKIIINDEPMILSQSQAFLLECIKYEKLNQENCKKYLDIITKEGISKHLIYQNPIRYISNGLLKATITFLIIAILLILIGIIANNLMINDILIWISLETLSLYIIYCFYFAIFNYNTIVFSFNRTDEGNEIFYRLNGLNNFLKAFSTLSESDIEYIKQWDDYLIYSVIFNQNKKIYYKLYKHFEDYEESMINLEYD